MTIHKGKKFRRGDGGKVGVVQQITYVKRQPKFSVAYENVSFPDPIGGTFFPHDLEVVE